MLSWVLNFKVWMLFKGEVKETIKLNTLPGTDVRNSDPRYKSRSGTVLFMLVSLIHRSSRGSGTHRSVQPCCP